MHLVWMMNIRQVVFTTLLVALPLAYAAYPSSKYTVKYATLAPAGSVWAKYVKLMEKEIEKRTNGAVDFRSYFGGVAGDENTIRRKLKAGLIDMGTFTGVSLGEILPEARVLELPMFFENYNEVDAAVNAQERVPWLARE